MGWTWTYIGYDRRSKTELMRGELERGGTIKVLKDAYVKGAYYAACVDNRRPSETFAIICLVKKTQGEFGYKDMDETMCPYEFNCPKPILDLLTPTEDKYAIEWRKRCNERKSEAKSVLQMLNMLPIGTIIETPNGKRWKKSAPCYQFKTPVFLDEWGCTYIPKSRIKKFKIVGGNA